jgi:chitin synthase
MEKNETENKAYEKVWGETMVLIVADGFEKANENGALDYLKEIKCFEEKAGGKEDEEQVEARIFDSNFRKENGGDMQLTFALKEENAGKLDSHKWAVDGFAEPLQDRLEGESLLLVLIDAGTKPVEKALYRLISGMESNCNIAGACGEIEVDHPFSSWSNPLVHAQYFEYKISHVMDKVYCEQPWG